MATSGSVLPPHDRNALLEELGLPQVPTFPRLGFLASWEILRKPSCEWSRAKGSFHGRLVKFLKETSCLFAKLNTCLARRPDGSQDLASVLGKPI